MGYILIDSGKLTKLREWFIREYLAHFTQLETGGNTPDILSLAHTAPPPDGRDTGL